jgi:hypothetical protein
MKTQFSQDAPGVPAVNRTETLWSAHEIVRLKTAIAERRREEMTEAEIRPLVDALDRQSDSFRAAVGAGVTPEDYWDANKPGLKNLLSGDPARRSPHPPGPG